MKTREEKKNAINKELGALQARDKELREQAALINRELVAIRDRINFLSGKLQGIEEDEKEESKPEETTKTKKK